MTTITAYRTIQIDEIFANAKNSTMDYNMEMKRAQYINHLMEQRRNGFIKVITGLRRVGKSYILNKLFYRYLINEGFSNDHIIQVELDRRENKELRNPDRLYGHILSKMIDQNEYIVLLDEIQLVPEFPDILNSLLHYDNLDIYATGSNSRFLSSDIVTEFRGRSREIHILPLTWTEFLEAYQGDESKAWEEYYTYGGLPQVVLASTRNEKADILDELYRLVYIKDIVERNNIKDPENLSELISVLSSQTGSLTNTAKLANTFSSLKKAKLSEGTINRYISHLEDAFLISKAERYDIKGKKYIGALRKYYFEDTGLRNVRLGLTQTEINHLMESIVFNELRYRGFSIRVGVIEQNYTNEKGSRAKKQLEIDFYATRHDRSFYIQCTLSLKDAGKRLQEERPFMLIRDSFRKIIIVEENVIPHNDENGIFIIGIKDFLSNKDILEY